MIVLFVVLLMNEAFGSITQTANKAPALPALFALDDYESCLRTAGDVYCAVRAKIVRGNNAQLMNYILNNNQTLTHYDYSYIERGLCIKKSCPELMAKHQNGRHLRSVLEACVNDTMAKHYDVEISLFDEYFCNKFEDKRSLSGMSWLVIFILSAVLVINVVGTLMFMFPGNERNPYIKAFSITNNWRKLAGRTEEYENSRSSFLKGLDSVRVILFFIIITPHNLFGFGPFIENTHDLEKGFKENFMTYVASGLSIVQLNFTISGFLLAYNLEILSEKHQLTWKSFPFLFMYRWLRLAPMYILVLLATAHVFPLMGSGPLWKMYAEYMANDCNRYFWHHLFFVNNYVPTDQCLIQTWHIAADTQVFSVGLLVYLLTKGRLRWFAITALLLLGLLIPSIHIWLRDFEGITLLTPELYRTIYTVSFRHFHVHGQNNVTCFSLGMLAGLLAYRWRQAPRSPMTPSSERFWRVVMWLTVPLIYGTIKVAQWIQFPEPPAAKLTRVAHYALHHLSLGGVMGLALLSLTTDVTTLLRRALEWRVWRAAGGVAYCCYLLHLHLIYYWLGSRTSLATFNLIQLALLQVLVFFGSYLIAIPLHLMVEAPINAIVKLFTTRLLQPVAKKKE